MLAALFSSVGTAAAAAPAPSSYADNSISSISSETGVSLVEPSVMTSGDCFAINSVGIFNSNRVKVIYTITVGDEVKTVVVRGRTQVDTDFSGGSMTATVAWVGGSSSHTLIPGPWCTV